VEFLTISNLGPKGQKSLVVCLGETGHFYRQRVTKGIAATLFGGRLIVELLDVDLSSVVTSQEDGTTPSVGRADFQLENVLGRRWEFEDSASTLICMRN
jgi:hypothetical protein